jgi:curli production assembly/transport component CsgE
VRGRSRGVPKISRLKASSLIATLLFCLVFSTSVAHAGRNSDPYVGVVSDGTITFIGQEFYREFVSAWRDQAQADQFSLSIQERPSARWGSLVWIEYSNKPLFRVFLSPGHRDYIRLAAREATQIVYRKVIDQALDQLGVDPDLAPDEL